jgi:hypothetical protein
MSIEHVTTTTRQCSTIQGFPIGNRLEFLTVARTSTDLRWSCHRRIDAIPAFEDGQGQAASSIRKERTAAP